ncbi:hypothetical protein BDR07DRAFT_1489596 [Suillus spraguei]|nr:hypothetical protein BDR07DRAFT_1489596 [Suillus spraguei]
MAAWKLSLVLIILVSTSICACCWAFVIVIWCKNYVILPDSVADIIYNYPTVLTLVSTVISTTLSTITTTCLSLAAKNAINHYITRPISLVGLRAAIALTKPQPLLQWSHRKLSCITLTFVGLITLLNSSWATLLLPTILVFPVSISGKDLDLGSTAFDAQLGLEIPMLESYMSASDMLDIMAPMSGTSATPLVAADGEYSVFSFNGVSYWISSGGIIPAVESYAGTTSTPGGIGLAYYGGKVMVNTVSNKHQGVNNGSYTVTSVTQQGLSANITCSDLDPDQYSLSFDNITSSVLGLTTTTWQWKASCPLGMGVSSSSTSSSDLLGIVVCPTPAPNTPNTTSFDVLLQGIGQYSFLNPTVCTVAPYVASFDVAYEGQMILVDDLPATNIQPLQNNSMNVTTFISNVVYRLSNTSQTTYNNPLGELLRLSTVGPGTTSVNEILQIYFSSIVEFSGTYLRSAYSAEGADSMMPDLYSDESAFTSLNGTTYIITYGWYSERLTYIYIMIVLTLIWALTVSLAMYSLIQEHTHPRTSTDFDASNPVHLMMASSAED